MIVSISNELFEQKSKEKFEKLKNAFLNTIKQVRWKKEESKENIIKYFLEEVALIPNDPFSEHLIKLLEWEYDSLAKDIKEILNQIEQIRQDLLPKERRVSYKNKYYNYHLVTRNKYIKEQIIYNAESEICYITRYKLKPKFKYFFQAKLARTKGI